MRYSVYKYFGTGNLGDAIQTIAMSRLLPGPLGGVDRGTSVGASADTLWILNGWLGSNVLPSIAVKPLFAGIYVAQQHNIAWLRASPFSIGARDPSTQELLSRHGMKSEVIGCATMTFNRYRGPRFGSYAVDVPESCGNSRAALSVTHEISWEMQWPDQWKLAIHMLELYRRANIVFTSRLHVALPCLAFGTPVYLCDPLHGQPWDAAAGERFSLARLLGMEFGRVNEICINDMARKYMAFLERNLGISVKVGPPRFVE